MGWIGDESRVLDALKARDADRDEQGRFLLRGGGVYSFLGIGPEVVVDDAVEFRAGGEWRPLCPVLSGGARATVI